MARWLQARLVPDHKDALATQRAANGAALAGLSEAQHQALLGRESLRLPPSRGLAADPPRCRAGFFHTDDLSFDEYLHTV